MSSDRIPSVAPDKLIFTGKRAPHENLQHLPDPPPWRQFDAGSRSERAQGHEAGDEEILAVNAALYLRRPLLVTGKPGTGKTSLAFAVAHELNLGPVFVWPITSRSTLQQGLYHYDAIGRLHDASLKRQANGQGADNSVAVTDIGRYVRLGALGAAFKCSRRGRPSVLLIDEIDKSDLDLPNDLLHIFEEGEFEIPELARLPDDIQTVNVGLPNSGETVEIQRGRVRCEEFPLVFLTSNDERDFPPAFRRRCIKLDIPEPNRARLEKIVLQRFGAQISQHQSVKQLLTQFLELRDTQNRQLATDQLLNAVSLVMKGVAEPGSELLKNYVFRGLGDENT